MIANGSFTCCHINILSLIVTDAAEPNLSIAKIPMEEFLGQGGTNAIHPTESHSSYDMNPDFIAEDGRSRVTQDPNEPNGSLYI